MNKNINDTTANNGFEEIGDEALESVAGGGLWGTIKKGYNAYVNSPVGRYFDGVGRRIYESETGQQLPKR